MQKIRTSFTSEIQPGRFFMRSGFTHPALIVSWQRKSANSASTGLTVEWSHPINSHKDCTDS